ncbi:MAG: cytochrome c3 family protein [Proteobacteria bacterium]|nr:cytochrome c3 family protein [Pseudomonadota bacterium]MBU1739752.1 cytochrome c3 family protein [Pseudomonadota bacterium]
MYKRWLFIVVPMMLALPSLLHAVGMEGLGGMGGFVDEVYLQTRDVGRVLFAHSIHGTDCNKCHPKVFIKKNNSNHATMKQMEKGKSCGACHNGKKVFSVTGNCAKCHSEAQDILFKNEEAGDVTFPHEEHLNNFGCADCHPALFKAKRGANKTTMAAMEKGESCGACHNGSEAFGVTDTCESCHKM